MLGYTSGKRNFVDKLYGVKKYIFGAFFCVIAAACIFTQTEQFLGFVAHPSHDEIREHIRLSRSLQDRQRQAPRNSKYIAPKEPVDTVFFSPEKAAEVKRARENVIKDEELAKLLSEKFQIASLDEVSAVYIPLGEMKTKDNCDHTGIQPTVWEEINNAKSQNPEGVTIRDKGPDEVKTVDGIPRIFLTSKAFDWPPQSLQRTVAHELLHAMNIPGYKWTIPLPGFKNPVPITILQNDLSYLAEYRWYVRKAGLETWDQTVIWAFITILLFSSAINVVVLLRYFRKLRHFRHNRLRRVR